MQISELRVFLADTEMPFAIVPNEMMDLPDFEGEEAIGADAIAAVKIANEVLQAHNMVAVPCLLDHSSGMFLMHTNHVYTPDQRDLLETVFDGNPATPFLEQYGAKFVLDIITPNKV